MNSTLSKRLKSLREKKGMAQKFVSSILDIKPNTLSGYESGRREPDASTLRSLAEFYEVSVDYLLGRETKDHFSNAEAIMFKDIEGFNDLPEEKQEEIRRTINEQIEFLVHKQKRDS